MIPLQFTPEDFGAAAEQWGANCGPGAIAAMLGLSMHQLRPYMGDFERKRYTNPTLMWETLKRLGCGWHLVKPPTAWPRYGLVRVQWEGPWTKPGVPMRARYRHTHWVGAIAGNPQNIGIFDVNALGNGSGWCSLADWGDVIVPWLLKECVPRADGAWHLTHVVEIDFQQAQKIAQAA